MRACISATTRPAFRITAISSADLRISLRSRRDAGPSGALSATRTARGSDPAVLVDDVDEPAGDEVGVAHAVDGLEQAAPLEPLEQRNRLPLVEIEPAVDRRLGVILAVDDVAAAHVAGVAVLGRLLGRVVRAAVDAHAPAG